MICVTLHVLRVSIELERGPSDTLLWEHNQKERNSRLLEFFDALLHVLMLMFLSGHIFFDSMYLSDRRTRRPARIKRSRYGPSGSCGSQADCHCGRVELQV